MATTIINPAPTSGTSDSNGVGLVVGGIIFLVFAFMFVIYGLPLLRGMIGSGGVQVNVPKSIDVNVQQTK